MASQRLALARQAGFTLAETAIVLAAIGLLTSVAALGALEAVRTADLRATILTAQRIANAAERLRHRVTSTTVDPVTGAVSHTFQTIGPDAPMNVFNGIYNMGARVGEELPTTSPFGTPYLVTADGSGPARVSVVVPITDIDPPGVEATPLGPAGTRLTVHARRSLSERRNRETLRRWVKRTFYLEDVR